MAVNAKLGVDLSSFQSGIKTGQSILKGLNAEMKATEAEFKATGNSEQLLANKTKTLNSQLQAQKGIADQAEKALKAMTDAGVDPADAAYQKLYATMMNAQAGMYETQAALSSLDASAQQAATGADQLTQSVNGIGKKLSLDQVISGIGKITDGLENAAKKAISLGEDIWNGIMNSAKWADDTKTMAQMYGIDVEKFQQMQKLVTNGMDTTVDSMLTSQQKLNNGIGKGTDEYMQQLVELGLAYEMVGKTGEKNIELVTQDQDDLFFRAGQAIMNMTDAFEKENVAQKLFGRSWKELVPLFESYKTVEEYNAALEQTQINSAEDVDKLAELNDKVGELKGKLETLANDVMAQLAPALTDAADALNGVLTSVLDYLKTEEGQEMLAKLGDAVSGLFGDLSKIDPEQVVSGFVEVFTKVTEGIQWLVDNAETAKGILGAVVGAWGLLTLGENVLKVVKLVDGIKGLTAADAASAGASAGSSWAGAFASAAMKAAPFLAFLYTLLNPSGSAGNDLDLVSNNGQITEGAMDFWAANMDSWYERQMAVGNKFGNLASLMGDQAALNIMLDPSLSDEEVFRKLQDELGIVPLDAEIDLPEDQKGQLEEQVGTLELPARVYVESVEGEGHKHGRGVQWNSDANGLAYVPYDGYLAQLHKGEMVVPAREVSSRNYNSNLYVESMYMNSGTDAEGLAAAMAAAQRRTMSGFGS